MKLHPYIAIARPDHWIKNVFVLPGILLAMVFSKTPLSQFHWKLILGLLSTCFVSSANYVINELCDAKFDRHHFVKRKRPFVVGTVKVSVAYIEYSILLLAGIILAIFISLNFMVVILIFALMGILYNVKPFRTKDMVYLDVLSESINNPIRLLLGWFIVTSRPLPPSTLVLGYWMGGAFLMSIKRYSEYLSFPDNIMAGLYRRSFNFYNEKNLLVSSFFYSNCSVFFLAAFMIKYRIELLLSFPLFAVLFAWYFYIGLEPDSVAQSPEKLFYERAFMLYFLLLMAVVTLLIVFEIPQIHWLLNNAFLEMQ